MGIAPAVKAPGPNAHTGGVVPQSHRDSQLEKREALGSALSSPLDFNGEAASELHSAIPSPPPFDASYEFREPHGCSAEDQRAVSETSSPLLAARMLFAFAVLLNLLGAELIFWRSSDGPLRQEFGAVLALLYAGCAFLLCLLWTPRLLRRARAVSLQRSIPSPDGCLLFSFLTAVGAAIVAATSEHSLVALHAGAFAALATLSAGLILIGCWEWLEWRSVQALNWRIASRKIGVRRVISTPISEGKAPEGSGDQSVEFVRASALRPDDRIELRPGDYVAVDGVIESGGLDVIEYRFSGSPERYLKGKGSRLFAGAEVLRGRATLVVVQTAEDATLSAFVEEFTRRMIVGRGSWSEGSSASLLAPIILVFFSICVALAWHDAGLNWSAALLRAGAVLAVQAPLLWMALRGRAALIAFSGCFRNGALCGSPIDIEALGGVRQVGVWWAGHGAVDAAYEIFRFDLLDQRVDERAIIATILALVGHSESPLARAITLYLLERDSTPAFVSLDSYRFYPEFPGFVGRVDRTEITIGCESFLIERGVECAPGELQPVESDGDLPLYVACGREIVARFSCRTHAGLELSRARIALKEVGIESFLAGKGESAELDALGKSAGYELAAVRGGLDSPAQIVPSVGSASEAGKRDLLLYFPQGGSERSHSGCNDHAKDGGGIEKAGREESNRRMLAAAPFNDLLWSFDGSAVTLLCEPGARGNALASVLKIARRAVAFRQIPLVVSGAVGGALLLGAASGVFSSLVVILTQILVTLLLGAALSAVAMTRR